MNQNPSCDNCSQSNTCGWKAQQSGRWCTGYTPLYQPTKTTAGTEMSQNEETCNNCGKYPCYKHRPSGVINCKDWSAIQPEPNPEQFEKCRGKCTNTGECTPVCPEWPEPEACVFEFRDGSGYHSSCGGWFECVHKESLPEDFAYCPYCGKKIEVKSE